MKNNKFKKYYSLLKDPRIIPSKIIRRFGKNISYFLSDKAFFMQGQMDIHPKSIWNKPEFISSTGGFYIKEDKVKRTISKLEPWDNTRRDAIILLLRTIITNDIPGDMAELGVYKGDTSKLIHNYAPERKLYLFDTFSGFTEKSVAKEKEKTGFEITAKQFSDTNIDEVTRNINPNENVLFFKGYFPENLPDDFDKLRFSFVHLDADLYEPTHAGLELFYSKMSRNGIILIHDYNAWSGARNATEDFLKDKPEIAIPLPDKSGSAIVIKQ